MAHMVSICSSIQPIPWPTLSLFTVSGAGLEKPGTKTAIRSYTGRKSGSLETRNSSMPESTALDIPQTGPAGRSLFLISMTLQIPCSASSRPQRPSDAADMWDMPQTRGNDVRSNCCRRPSSSFAIAWVGWSSSEYVPSFCEDPTYQLITYSRPSSLLKMTKHSKIWPRGSTPSIFSPLPTTARALPGFSARY